MSNEATTIEASTAEGQSELKRLVMRLRLALGWHQCTAVEGDKKRGWVCCTRHNWHLGKHRSHSGHEVRGQRMKFDDWINSRFSA